MVRELQISKNQIHTFTNYLEKSFLKLSLQNFTPALPASLSLEFIKKIKTFTVDYLNTNKV